MRGKYLSLKPFALWRQLARPCPWHDCFPSPGPLELEVGFGNGEYLCRQAQAHPERRYVGLELHWGSIRRTLRRLAQAPCPNVCLLQVDARLALERLFAPRSLSGFTALFPCPWPKHKHAHHRLFSPRFMSLLNSRMEEGAEALIVTDHEALHRFISANLKEAGFVVDLRHVGPSYNTKYERRWTEGGQEEFFEFHLRKVEHREHAVPEEVPLVTLHVPHFDAEKFQPQGQRGELTVEFKSFLYDPLRQIGMALALVAEEGLTQTFWIEVVKDDRGWAISPAPGGGVVPCRSVHRALELVFQACAAEAGA